MAIEIDPEVTRADVEYMKMTPAERKQRHIDQGMMPYDDNQYTDEAMIAWFERMGEVGKVRLAAVREALGIVKQVEVKEFAPPDVDIRNRNVGKIQVEQILADGKPAVKVTRWIEVSLPISPSMSGGWTEPQIRNRVVNYYRFPGLKPAVLLGMPMVGQFGEKCIGKPEIEVPNTDPTTYQDYHTWMDAMHEVYSNS